MCEGPNELAIIRILMDNDMLIFNQDDLLGLTPYHARQIIRSSQIKTELNSYDGLVDIARVGDTQTDTLKIPKEYKGRFASIEKYCTKPELEMLLIIAEGLAQKYMKVKSKSKTKDNAKEYAKENITYNGKKYDNSTQFFYDYFGNRPKLLYDSIIEYKRIHKSHSKDEKYLADLLK